MTIRIINNKFKKYAKRIRKKREAEKEIRFRT